MGRRSKYGEFLNTLKDVTELPVGKFAKLVGKKTTNVSQYLSGAKKAGKSVAKSGVRHLSEWQVTPLFEVEETPEPLTTISNKPGIYSLYDSAGNVLYVGQAKNLRMEINQTLNRKTNFPVLYGPNLSKKKYPKYKTLTIRISAYIVESKRLRHNLEALILRIFPNQSHNNKLGSFK